jgi:hypothetical protein
MSRVFDDEFHGQGGSYEVRDGKRVLVEPPTADHPDGNRARDADGTPHDQPDETAPALPVPGQQSLKDA